MAKDGLITVSLDAMGGDFAPEMPVKGAVDAVRKGGVEVILVGDEEVVRAELAKHDGADDLPISIYGSTGVVEEGEAPAQAFRSKPRASIFVATNRVKRGIADAVVSMGSSGGTIAAASFLFGTFDGIERGTLGGPIIGLSPNTMIFDVGVNVDVKPSAAADFAALGATMARLLNGIENPRVALLSIGAEEGKGNKFVKETTEILKTSPVNFIGNVEASDLPFDCADVVITDGFTGNVVMKLTESLGVALAKVIREYDSSTDNNELADKVFELTNPVTNYGGGPLLGVRGLAIIGHGKAGAYEVSQAIHTARKAVESDFIAVAEKEMNAMRKSQPASAE
ncbi:MAG: phosphate acyltransferase PlsX [Chloroflexi bacterium]|nr:phosphate acyltransferase PlsX [Chloroflexota bacterium]